jgi:hypothetical protein
MTFVLVIQREGFTLHADGSWHTVDTSDDVSVDGDGGGLNMPPLNDADGHNVHEFAPPDDGDIWGLSALMFGNGDEFDDGSDEEDAAGSGNGGFGCHHYQRNCRCGA